MSRPHLSIWWGVYFLAWWHHFLAPDQLFRRRWSGPAEPARQPCLRVSLNKPDPPCGWAGTLNIWVDALDLLGPFRRRGLRGGVQRQTGEVACTFRLLGPLLLEETRSLGLLCCWDVEVCRRLTELMSIGRGTQAKMTVTFDRDSRW